MALRKKSQILNMVYNSGSQTVTRIRILGGFVKTQIADLIFILLFSESAVGPENSHF